MKKKKITFIFLILYQLLCLQAQENDTITLPPNISYYPFNYEILGKPYIELPKDSSHIENGNIYVILFFNENNITVLKGFNITALILRDSVFRYISHEYHNIVEDSLHYQIKDVNFYPKEIHNYYYLLENFIKKRLIIKRNYNYKFESTQLLGLKIKVKNKK